MLSHPLVDELIEHFVVRDGYLNAPKSMALELIQANLKIMQLEKDLAREERKVSAGYVRRDPGHRARQPKPQMVDAVTDDWVYTGRTGDAS